MIDEITKPGGVNLKVRACRDRYPAVVTVQLDDRIVTFLSDGPGGEERSLIERQAMLLLRASVIDSGGWT